MTGTTFFAKPIRKAIEMGKKRMKNKEKHRKAPLIRSVVPILIGITMLVSLIFGFYLESIDNDTEILFPIIGAILFGGVGILMIINGIKKRRW